MNETRTNPQKIGEDELPPLPPLDDDDEPLGDAGDDDLGAAYDDAVGLDDETGEADDLARWGAVPGIFEEEAGLLDDAGDADLPAGGDAEMIASAELGLLEDSDEGDGRDLTAEEAGLLEGDEATADDGGAEGTGEDPGAALDDAIHWARSEGDEDDGDGFDDARFSDGRLSEIGGRSFEREAWPRRADVPWIAIATERRRDFVGIEPVTAEGDLVAAVEAGTLLLSRDGGGSFTRLPTCTGVTAITLLPGGLQAIAALHDPVQEATAIVVVRVAEGTAEVVADLLDDGGEGEVRIESLRARTNGPAVEVLAEGAGGGAWLLRPKK
jgi:hypothetical protein